MGWIPVNTQESSALCSLIIPPLTQRDKDAFMSISLVHLSILVISGEKDKKAVGAKRKEIRGKPEEPFGGCSPEVQRNWLKVLFNFKRYFRPNGNEALARSSNSTSKNPF